MTAEARISFATCALLLIAFVAVLYDRGGPYFQSPPTIVEHVFRDRHETRDALLALPLIRPLLPRGAVVACFRPDGRGKWQCDVPVFHTAIALLPHQTVVAPFAASDDIPRATMAEYVIAIDRPFTNPAYKLEAEFATGRLYKVMR